MKQSLADIVNSILSDMDSEAVDSISETTEAGQVARIVRDTFYNLIATRDVPEHHELLKLTAASDSEFPTHFQYGENVKEISNLWYMDEDSFYKSISWVEPMDFLKLTDTRTDSYKTVYDKSGGTSLRIATDRNPSFYTSFDDDWIVMDAHLSTLDTTLMSSKVRAYGVVYPVFSLTDTYVPDIDATMFPYLIAEAKSTAMSLLKGQSDSKIEQAARRHKSYIQNDMYRTRKETKRQNYGRR